MHRAAGLLVRRQLLEGVGELDLAAAAGLRGAEYAEDVRVEDVAADDGVVGRGVGRVRLLDQAADLDDVAVLGGLHGRAAVEVDLLRRDLHEGDHAAAVLLLDVDHALEQGVARVDQVVAEQDREGLVADVRLGAQHGVAEALGVALADVVDHREVAGLLDLGEAARVALLLEGGLQFVVAVEVVFQGALVAARDHEDVAEARGHGLFDHVLDRRLVDDRQHLLGSGLGGRQEPGTETGCWDDSLADPGVGLSHARHPIRCL